MISPRLACLIAVAGVGATLASAGQDSFELYRPLHTEAARFERENRVRQLYADAAESARESVLTLFQADDSTHRSALSPRLSTLAAAELVLRGGSSAVGPDPAESLLGALDLRLTPGAFAVRGEGRGEPITVRLEPLYKVQLPSDVVVGLDWIAPDGTRTRARTEAFMGSVFDDGLDMYIRPPASEAGNWQLAPVLIQGERELRAPGVPASCFGELDRVREQLQAGSEGSRVEPHRALWIDWNRLRDFGVRPTNPASIPERLAHFGLPGGSDWSHDYGWISFGEKDELGAWGMAPEGRTQNAVILLSDGRRSQAAVFAGELESGWSRYADHHDCFVLSITYSGNDVDAARFDALLGLLREQGVEDVALVASGDAALMLPAHLRRLPEGSFDRLLLHSTSALLRGVRLALEAPVLGLAHGQASESVVRQEPDDLSGEMERWWVGRRGPAFLTVLELPALLERWTDGSLQ